MRLQSAAADSLQAASQEPFSLSSALSSLVAKLADWVEAFILALPNLAVAIIIVLVAVLIARGVRKLVFRLVDGIGEHMESMKSVRALMGTLAYVAALSAGVFIALGILNLDGVVTSLLAGAGIVGLAMGFAFQDIAANFISGVLLAIRAPFRVGDLIQTNDFLGTVKEVNLRATFIDTFQGQRVIIPNAAVYQNPLTNYTTNHHRRVDVSCGVGYGDDLDLAERVAKEAVEGIEGRETSRDIELFYTEFGDSSINFTLRFWLSDTNQKPYLAAQSDAIKRIKTAFDEAGVTIPFPIRTLDFDPNGGLALRDAWPSGDGASASASQRPAQDGS